TNILLSYVGPETKNGVNVIHVSGSQVFASATADAALQHASQLDIYLDATSFLPVAYVFNLHPDDNELADIPVEVRYSNYQSSSGIQVPLRVQRYLNNVLELDLQFQTVLLNTNVSVSQLNAQ